MAMTNYSPNTDRPEDLPLSAGETVRLLTEDGAWAFVCTVDPTRRRGWVPASILKKKGGIQHSYARLVVYTDLNLQNEYKYVKLNLFISLKMRKKNKNKKTVM